MAMCRYGLRIFRTSCQAKGPAVESAFDPDFGHLEPRDQVKACVRTVEKAGLDFLVLNQTRPDIEVPVVRVIVPGIRHFYRRFAPGRAVRCAGAARMAQKAGQRRPA